MANGVFKMMKIEDLHLDTENPRIKQYLEIYEGNVTAEGIALALQNPGSNNSSTSFRSLKESIRVSNQL